MSSQGERCQNNTMCPEDDNTVAFYKRMIMFKIFSVIHFFDTTQICLNSQTPKLQWLGKKEIQIIEAQKEECLEPFLSF